MCILWFYQTAWYQFRFLCLMYDCLFKDRICNAAKYTKHDFHVLVLYLENEEDDQLHRKTWPDHFLIFTRAEQMILFTPSALAHLYVTRISNMSLTVRTLNDADIILWVNTCYEVEVLYAKNRKKQEISGVVFTNSWVRKQTVQVHYLRACQRWSPAAHCSRAVCVLAVSVIIY